MATRTRSLIQDENLTAHFKATSIGKETNFLKFKKALTRLGGWKPLTNIIKSRKPSPCKATKKNHTTKLDNVVEDLKPKSILIHDENLNSHSKGDSVGGKSMVSNAQKKAGLGGGGGGGRRALTEIANSKKSLHPELKKNYSKKLNDIAEEQCLHNHQECIKSQNSGMDRSFLWTTLGFDDDPSMHLSTPCLLPASVPPEVDSFTPLRHEEYEEAPELLNEDQFSPQCSSPEHPITTPFQNHYVSSLTLMLLGSP